MMITLNVLKPCTLLNILVAVILLLIVVYGETYRLYEPIEVTSTCSSSKIKTFHLTYGMGTSDTLTLQIRVDSINGKNFTCFLEFRALVSANLIFIVQFPLQMAFVCHDNLDVIRLSTDGITNQSICSLDWGTDTYEDSDPNFNVDIENSTKFYRQFFFGPFLKIRFFNDQDQSTLKMLDFYLLSVTTARTLNKTDKCRPDEAFCHIRSHEFCFTSEVNCDGVKNCGRANEYDEDKLLCGTHAYTLEWRAIITLVMIVCMVLNVMIYLVGRLVPKLAKTFFIFNENEDCRLYVRTIHVKPDSANLKFKLGYSSVEGSIASSGYSDALTRLPVFGSAQCAGDKQRPQYGGIAGQYGASRRRTAMMSKPHGLLAGRDLDEGADLSKFPNLAAITNLERLRRSHTSVSDSLSEEKRMRSPLQSKRLLDAWFKKVTQVKKIVGSRERRNSKRRPQKDKKLNSNRYKTKRLV